MKIGETHQYKEMFDKAETITEVRDEITVIKYDA